MVELPSTVVDSKDIGRVRYRYLPGNGKYCHTGGTKEFPTLADFQGNFQKTLFTRARRFPSEFPETYAQGKVDALTKLKRTSNTELPARACHVSLLINNPTD